MEYFAQRLRKVQIAVSQVAQCSGACDGGESPQSHTSRMLAALNKLRLQRWPYAGAVGIREGHSWHVVNNWHYLGAATTEAHAWQLAGQGPPRFDRDVYQMLHKKIGGLQHRIRQFF